MKNAIIIHGSCSREEYFDDKYPSLSNSHWLPWLQKQLLIKNILTQAPEMPEAYNPVYEEWAKELERFEVNEKTILVGHSCGGGFLLRWLTENKVKVNKLVLVAPWLDPQRKKSSDFFDFSLDSTLNDRVGEIHLLFSEDDKDDILESVKIIQLSIPEISIHRFTNHGHFCLSHMKTDHFPELLDIIILSK